MTFDEIVLRGLWVVGRHDDLVDPDPEAKHIGVYCATEWCVARRNHQRECGDRNGDYALLVHVNRQYRALYPEGFCPEGLCDGSGYIPVDLRDHPSGGVNPCPCQTKDSDD